MTVIRFSGLASGLDTESIVKAMLMPQQQKIDNSRQDKQLMEWRQEAYKKVSSKVYAFFTETASKLRLQSTFNSMKTTVSNPNAISMSERTGGVLQGTHTVQVNQLASGAMVPSDVIRYTDVITGELKVANEKTSLSDIGFVNNQGITIETPNGSATVRLGDVKVNAAGEPMLDVDDNPTFVETIDDLSRQMRMKLQDTDISFGFDSRNGAFMISSKKTGEAQQIEIKDADGGNGAMDLINIKPNPKDGSYVFTGTNAEVVYNNSLTISSETNGIQVNGLDFTVTNKTTEPVRIVATKNIEDTTEVIKDFVNKYNELLEELNLLVDTRPPRHGQYKPLTEEDKSKMSEKEIEQWEEKARAGMFYNDPVLESLISNMRSITGTVFEKGSFKTLEAIGIKQSPNWRDKGQLVLSEESLKKALNENAEDIMKMFAYSEEGVSSTKGIGTMLYETLNMRFRSSADKSAHILFADKALSSQLERQVERIKDFEQRMTRMEDLYYKRFTAMEKALSLMESQSGFLMQQSRQ